MILLTSCTSIESPENVESNELNLSKGYGRIPQGYAGSYKYNLGLEYHNESMRFSINELLINNYPMKNEFIWMGKSD